MYSSMALKSGGSVHIWTAKLAEIERFRSSGPQDLGDAAVGRQTRDRKVAGSTPDRSAIKSTRSTQPPIPPG